ncbi:MAG: hypothetical protein JWO77_3445 [Ilumatobacteraceae bacterium]|nr:hypothetical protein [Ilumatobacteraceae bacterium]
MRALLRALTLAVVIAFALSGPGIALPVSADASGAPPTAAESIAAVNAAAPAPAIDATQSMDELVADQSGTEVSISTEPSAGTDIRTAEGSLVEIGVPGSASEEGTITGSEVVYRGVAVDATAVSRPTAEGAQTLLVLDGSDAPTTFRFPISVDGAAAQLREDAAGAVTVISREDGEAVATIAPAWATDADGHPVPTSFRVDGNVLIQTVQHRGASYPVVADPNTCGVTTCTYYFNKQQTRDLAKLPTATAVCAFLYKFPIFAAGCASAGAVVAYQADRAKDRKMCLKIKYTRFGVTVWWPDIYSGRYCK